LLPGSRRKEISALLPDFLAAAKRLIGKYDHEFVFLLPVASTVSEEELLHAGIEGCSEQVKIHLIHENRYDMMAACDAVVAASGTVTLELAILEIPMVVVYKLAPHTYFLGKLLIRHLQFFSLVNLIAGRQVVPELLQDQVNPANIEKELASLLFNKQIQADVVRGLKSVRAQLGRPGASRQAAKLALKLLGRKIEIPMDIKNEG
jgi:lipid-A-disaccharide synthase